MIAPANNFVQGNGSRLQWLAWFVITLILVPVTCALPSLALRVLFDENDPGAAGLLFAMFFGMFGAIGSAVGQYAVLRTWIISPTAWFLVSALTGAISSLLGQYAGALAGGWAFELESILGIELKQGIIFWMIACGTIGLAVGISQWYLLRVRLRHASYWILLTLAVWEIWSWIIFGESCLRGSYLCH